MLLSHFPPARNVTAFSHNIEWLRWQTDGQYVRPTINNQRSHSINAIQLHAMQLFTCIPQAFEASKEQHQNDPAVLVGIGSAGAQISVSLCASLPAVARKSIPSSEYPIHRDK